jgi:hypothetical protein
MSLRPKLAGLFAVLVASATLLLSGCSSSSPRDINYGTDVGLGYVPPDVPPAADIKNAYDSANAMDGGVLVDGGMVDGVVDGVSDGAVDGAVDGASDGVMGDASTDGNN